MSCELICAKRDSRFHHICWFFVLSHTQRLARWLSRPRIAITLDPATL